MERRTHTIDRAFLLAVLAVFAIGSLLVSVFGARQYQKTISNMDKNHEERTCSTYIREKVRQAGENATVEIADIDGVSVLKLTQELNDGMYSTYIYAKDGSLCEVLLPYDSVFETSMGEDILPINEITFKKDNNGLLDVDIVLPSGSTQTAFISCNSIK